MAQWIEVRYTTAHGETGIARRLATDPHDQRRSLAAAQASAETAARRSLELEMEAMRLQLIGIKADQQEIALRQREDADGTSAFKQLQHQAALIREGNPQLSEAEALTLAIQRNPGLYREHADRRAASAGATLAPSKK
jgi:hypothetical protein